MQGAVTTDAPQQSQRERLPRCVAPLFNRGFAETPNQIVVQMLIVYSVRPHLAVRIVAAVTQIAHDPAFSLVDHARLNGLRHIRSETRQCIGLRNEPTQFFHRSRLQGVLQHRHPDLEWRGERSQFDIGPFGQIASQHDRQIFEPNPPASQLLAIAVFSEIRLHTEEVRPEQQPLFERQIFQSLQRVEKHKGRDRSMNRQQLGRLLDRTSQAIMVGRKWLYNLGSRVSVYSHVPLLQPQGGQ